MMVHEIGRSEEFDQILMRFVDGYDDYISVGAGWGGLVKECHDTLVAFDPNYRIYQIKQKFGGLRYYVKPSIDALVYRTSAIIAPFEKRSYMVCEVCGADGNLRVKNRHYQTLCAEHGPDGDGFVSASTVYS
jgi:hypothetical protein